jgi:cell division protein FtsX
MNRSPEDLAISAAIAAALVTAAVSLLLARSLDATYAAYTEERRRARFLRRAVEHLTAEIAEAATQAERSAGVRYFRDAPEAARED